MSTPEAIEYVELVARIHEVYRHLEMDTDEDRAIHAQHVAQADRALELARKSLAPRVPDANPHNGHPHTIAGECIHGYDEKRYITQDYYTGEPL